MEIWSPAAPLLNRRDLCLDAHAIDGLDEDGQVRFLVDMVILHYFKIPKKNSVTISLLHARQSYDAALPSSNAQCSVERDIQFAILLPAVILCEQHLAQFGQRKAV
jgi:hypothetical protein